MSLRVNIERPNGDYEEVGCDDVQFQRHHVVFWLDGVPFLAYHADEIRTMTTDLED